MKLLILKTATHCANQLSNNYYTKIFLILQLYSWIIYKSLHPNDAFKSSARLWLSIQILFVDADIEFQVIAA